MAFNSIKAGLSGLDDGYAAVRKLFKNCGNKGCDTISRLEERALKEGQRRVSQYSRPTRPVYERSISTVDGRKINCIYDDNRLAETNISSDIGDIFVMHHEGGPISRTIKVTGRGNRSGLAGCRLEYRDGTRTDNNIMGLDKYWHGMSGFIEEVALGMLLK